MNSEYFQCGAKVTICSDAEGKHPRRIGVVKRIGNGAWRLGGCSEWYNFQGQRVAVDNSGKLFDVYAPLTCFAHPYQEGDEARIEAESIRLKQRHDLFEKINSISNQIGWANSSIKTYNKELSRNQESILEAERRLDYARAILAQTRGYVVNKEAHRDALIKELDKAKLELHLFDAQGKQDG